MPGCGRVRPRTRTDNGVVNWKAPAGQKAITRVAELAATLPGTRLVYVADREADIVALMAQARDLGHPADWLIRSQHNRPCPKEASCGAELLAGEALGGIRFTMPSRQGQKARDVRQRVWAKRVTVADGHGGRIEVNCLVAREERRPRGSQAGGMAAVDQSAD